MKNQIQASSVATSKIVAIYSLFSVAVLIMLLGVAFSIYSAVYDVHFMVLTSSIHGAIFGLVILYLGVRYFLSVKKLKTEVYKSNSKFSWSNFKKHKN